MTNRFICVAVAVIVASIELVVSAGDGVGPDAAADVGKLPLLQLDQLQYLGAFRVPAGKHGLSGFDYGGTALAYCSAHNSLFLVGHDHQQAIAEISIPEPKKVKIGDLNTAGLLQSFVRIHETIPNFTLEGNVKIGGLMVVGDKLAGTLYEYYDGNANAQDSHFMLSSLQLDKAKVDGLFRVGKLGGGVVGGYMTPVPEEWQQSLGAPYLTGLAGIAIISRSSSGPAAFGFDPAAFGKNPARAVPYVYYPLNKPLANSATQNPLFNTTTEIRGVVFPAQTRSILFFGSHGTGPWCYGTPEECKDTDRGGKGPHAPPYVFQIWAYDANDFAAAARAKRAPSSLRPYAVWPLELPYPDRSKNIGGVAFNPDSRTVYVSQLNVDSLIQYDARPVIHVFKLLPPVTQSR